MTEIRHRVEKIVTDVLIAQDGPTAIVSVPIGHGYSTLVDRPTDYLAAMGAVRSVIDAAERLARDYATRARGAGQSWDEVAAELQAVTDEDDDPGVAAYRWVAPNPPQPYDRITISWVCASCSARVTDHGPFSGHPDDDEEGHLASCTRHQNEVADYHRRTGWERE